MGGRMNCTVVSDHGTLPLALCTLPPTPPKTAWSCPHTRGSLPLGGSGTPSSSLLASVCAHLPAPLPTCSLLGVIGH